MAQEKAAAPAPSPVAAPVATPLPAPVPTTPTVTETVAQTVTQAQLTPGVLSIQQIINKSNTGQLLTAQESIMLQQHQVLQQQLLSPTPTVATIAQPVVARALPQTSAKAIISKTAPKKKIPMGVKAALAAAAAALLFS